MHSARIIFCCALLPLCVQVYSQAPAQSFPIHIDKPNKFYVYAYKENESMSGNCNKPITYTIKTQGTCPVNMILSWSYTYYDCNSKEITKDMSVPIPSGKTGYTSPHPLGKLLKIKTVINESRAKIDLITIPSGFYITGDTSVLEGESIKLRVNPGNTASSNVVWIWYKRGSQASMGSGNSVTVSPTASTVYQLRAYYKGFLSAPHNFPVTVRLKPSPPKNFYIIGDKKIREGDTIDLSINVRDPMSGVRWWWNISDGKSQPMLGSTISVHPKVTTIYRLQAELNGKRSEYKYFTVEVTSVPEPPSGFIITGKNRIKEGGETTLRVTSENPATGVRWLWYRREENQPFKEGESVVVYPDETTIYQVRAVTYKKISKPKSFTVNVDVTAKRPSVIGSRNVCAVKGNQELYYVSGGRLGTNSQYWQWYQVTGTSEKKIGTGNSIYIPVPANTTSYYVRPDSDPSVSTRFTVEVTQPTVLPSQIMAPEIICHDQRFTVMVNSGQLAEGAQWIWYAMPDGASRSVKFGEGNSVITSATKPSFYFVRAEGGICPMSKDIQKHVNVITKPSANGYVYVTRIKRNKVRLTAINIPSNDYYNVSWYTNSCGDVKIDSGKSIEYRVRRKGSVIYMRLEGNCDNLDCKYVSLTHYKKARQKYTFFNFGVTDENPSSSFKDGIFTLGRRTWYLRAKFNLKDLQGIVKDDYEPIKPKYNHNENAILNYPTNNTYYLYNNNTIEKRTSYTLGFMAGFRNIRMYWGAGYGKQETITEFGIYDRSSNRLIQKEWAKNITRSISGVEGETGLFIKLGWFNLMGGASIIYSPSEKRNYTDWHAGIGFSIRDKKRR